MYHSPLEVSTHNPPISVVKSLNEPLLMADMVLLTCMVSLPNPNLTDIPTCLMALALQVVPMAAMVHLNNPLPTEPTTAQHQSHMVLLPKVLQSTCQVSR